MKDLEKRLRELEEKVHELTYNNQKLVEDSIRRSFSVEAQSQTLYAPLVGYCVSTIDPLKLNRIRVYHPLLSEPDVKISGLPFARACSNAGGFDDCGLSWVPPAGSAVVLVCENGDRHMPIYVGTVWNKNRGPSGAFFPYPIPEFYKLWKHENYRGMGYLFGKEDGSQVYPPWSSESGNGIEYDSEKEIDKDPDAQKKATYSNIYGLKTPGRQMLKFVDGDPRCNDRWARLELMSKFHWLMFKDDYYHPAGEWANPKICSGGSPDDTNCDSVSALLDLNISGVENAVGDNVQTGNIVGGLSSSTSCKTNLPTKPTCSNPYFKRYEEGRPYRGASNPQNNKCALIQSGIQLQALSGHRMVMDDSVNQPREKRINWLREFDYGCDNINKGKFYLTSGTGHFIGMNDSEEVPEIRGEENGIKLLTACGNYIKLIDHSLDGCIAGKKRGIEMGTSSLHNFTMCDAGNEQCSPTRKEGGIPTNKANGAFIQLRTGFGIVFRMDDSTSQTATDKQSIILAIAPKETNDPCIQPHALLMQLDKTNGGFIELASGGKFIMASKKDFGESIGTDTCKANKITQVFGNYLINAKEVVFTKSKTELHLADKYIVLGAGLDCDINNENVEEQAQQSTGVVVDAIATATASNGSAQTKGPCILPIIIAKDPVICPLTSILHWTSYSDRVFAASSS